ncbi:MAG: T9SS type A sorting domain-containing protein [Chitinophagales bacterium]|nr:T9SS type A sorting domain-containing protein [Chitinophagales bacterium]
MYFALVGVIASALPMRHQQVKFYDLNGVNVISTESAELQFGSPLQVPTANLAQGMYIVKVQTSTTSFTQKIVIQ